MIGKVCHQGGSGSGGDQSCGSKVGGGVEFFIFPVASRNGLKNERTSSIVAHDVDPSRFLLAPLNVASTV